MNKKISLGAAIAFALIVAAAVFSVTMTLLEKQTNASLVSLKERESQYSKFSEIDREVRSKYYGDILETELLDNTAKGFIAGIGDPNAAYYSAEEYSTLRAESELTTATVGLTAVPTSEGYLEVTEVFPDSPAELAEIKVGSIIIEMDGENITVSNNQQKVNSLSGPDGSQISLKIRYDGGESTKELVRRMVSVPTIYWEMLEGRSIAYVKITDFKENTANQFSRALKEIQEAGGEAIIFDLRDNENYELEYAYRILDRLVPAGPLVYAKYKDGTNQELEISDSTEITWPMAVVVNGGTAGTGEIFTQILKDYGKAKAVGSTTAGKGIKLETIPLSDGSAIRLTVARYETPNGYSFDGEGILPDFEVATSGTEEVNWQQVDKKLDSQINKAIESISLN